MNSEQAGYYKAHQQEIARLYTGKYVLICNFTILGAFNSFIEASAAALKKRLHKEFVIKYVA